MVSFDNTEYAFAYKSNKELKEAKFLFGLMGKPWIVNMGLKLAPFAIRNNIPFTNAIIRSTIFKQFVGGETMEATAPVVQKLQQYGVKVILDYGVEGGTGENAFDEAASEFIKVIKYASHEPNIPFMSIKVTGLVRFGLLERLDELMHTGTGNLIDRLQYAESSLTNDETQEWNKGKQRLRDICEAAFSNNVGIMVDAEDSWIQDPVDAITMQMMEQYNKTWVCVYNTLQLYRHDRLAFLRQNLEDARAGNFILGAKLVRGAYMEKERERAEEKNYPSPIQPDKASTDRDYDAAVEFCFDHLENIAVIIASHNEKSNMLGVELLSKHGLKPDHERVHFSQLFGMSDNITFNLARHGCSVSKYLPFGPIKDVVPYLMRRAQENSSVAGQTGRELSLINKELKRRGQ